MQRQAITPVDEATRTLAQTNRPSTGSARGPEQRRAHPAAGRQQDGNRDDGLEQKLRHMLEDLRNFKIANPDAEQQMQEMLQRLGMLRDRHVEPAEQGLSRASKSLAADPRTVSGSSSEASPLLRPNPRTAQKAVGRPARMLRLAEQSRRES